MLLKLIGVVRVGDEPVPMILMAGTDDPIIPYAGGPITLPLVVGDRGRVVSALATANVFAAEAGLSGTATPFIVPDLVNDGTLTTRYVYDGGAPGTAVEFLSMQGGGHQWPAGQSHLPEWVVGPPIEDFNACLEIWDFFQRNGRRAQPKRTIRIKVEGLAPEGWHCDPQSPYRGVDQESAVFSQLNPHIDAILTFTHAENG